MTVEQRLDQLEKRNKRLTVALTMMAVTICAVVTVAATGEKISDFDIVRARHIAVTNEAGEVVVTLGTTDSGNGAVNTWSAKGKDLVALGASVDGDFGAVRLYRPNGKALVTLGATVGGDGAVTTYHLNGKELVDLGSTDNGGIVMTYQPNGKALVELGTSDNGGLVYVFNKTGESIAQMRADEYSNGVVWAGNRKGMGRELKPGP